MPVLAVYIDAHSQSLLVYKSQTENWLYNFPYVYSSGIFSAAFDENAFYQSVFETHLAQHNLSLKDVDIILSGFINPPYLSFGVKFSKGLSEVLANVHSFYPIVANNFMVASPENLVSMQQLISRPHDMYADITEVDEENYYANMYIYPQVVANDISVQLDIDKNILELGKKLNFQAKNVPIVFCGSRFTQKTVNPELDYLLMLDLIRNPGIYEIRIDRFNSTILTTLLKMYDKNLDLPANPEPQGTLISTKSSLECMVRSQVGTSQLVQLDKNRIVIIPVGYGEDVNIMIKSKDISNTEKTVNGGKLGLIFDTREERVESMEEVKIFNSGVKTFSSALGN